MGVKRTWPQRHGTEMPRCGKIIKYFKKKKAHEGTGRGQERRGRKGKEARKRKTFS